MADHDRSSPMHQTLKLKRTLHGDHENQSADTVSLNVEKESDQVRPHYAKRPKTDLRAPRKLQRTATLPALDQTSHAISHLDGTPFRPDLSTNIQPLHKRLEIHRERNELKQADEAAKQLGWLIPESERWKVLYERGCLAEKDGDPASALAFFRQALENAPKNEEVITALLRVLDVLRQFQHNGNGTITMAPHSSNLAAYNNTLNNQVAQSHTVDIQTRQTQHVRTYSTTVRASDGVANSRGLSFSRSYENFNSSTHTSSSDGQPSSFLPETPSSITQNQNSGQRVIQGIVPDNGQNLSHPPPSSVSRERPSEILTSSGISRESPEPVSSFNIRNEFPRPRSPASQAHAMDGVVTKLIDLDTDVQVTDDLIRLQADPSSVQTSTDTLEKRTTAVSGLLIESSDADDFFHNSQLSNEQAMVLVKPATVSASQALVTSLSRALTSSGSSAESLFTAPPPPATPKKPEKKTRKSGPKIASFAQPTPDPTPESSNNLPNPVPPEAPNSSSPLMTGIDSAFFMKYIADSLGHLSRNVAGSLEGTQTAIQANTNQLGQVLQQISSLRSFSAGNTSLNVPSTAFPETRCRPMAKRVDPFTGQPKRKRFLDVVAKHVRHLMGISTYQQLQQVRRPLTEAEIAAFEAGAPGCIILEDAFQFDLKQSRKSAFNQEAIRFAAAHFINKYHNAGWYSQYQFPGEYIKQEYIELLIFNHLKHVKTQYRTKVLAPSEAVVKSRLKDGARSSRKARLGIARLNVTKDHLEFRRHVDLMEAVGTQATSSDEEGVDDSGHKLFRRVSPAWRSKDLRDFMWLLDDVGAASRAPKIGHRSIKGAEPRRRLKTDGKNFDSTAPPGLPFNCYDNDWREALNPYQQRMLKAQKKAYNFGIGEDRGAGPNQHPSKPTDSTSSKSITPSSWPHVSRLHPSSSASHPSSSASHPSSTVSPQNLQSSSPGLARSKELSYPLAPVSSIVSKRPPQYSSAQLRKGKFKPSSNDAEVEDFTLELQEVSSSDEDDEDNI